MPKLGTCEHKPCGNDADMLLGAAKRRLCAAHGLDALLALPDVRQKYTDLELAAFKVSRDGRYRAVAVIGVHKDSSAEEASYDYATWQPKDVVYDAGLAACISDVAEDIREKAAEG